MEAEVHDHSVSIDDQTIVEVDADWKISSCTVTKSAVTLTVARRQEKSSYGITINADPEQMAREISRAMRGGSQS